MKLWKKILLILLAVFLLVQIPFVYNRYKIGKLAAQISRLDAKKSKYSNPNYKDYKGVIHVHSFLGGHSTGNFDELIEGARKNDLDFVLMTEHDSKNYDTSLMTLNGFHNGVLFVGGNEFDTKSGDRLLLVGGSSNRVNSDSANTNQVLEKIHSQEKIALVTYPQKFKSWNSDFDGIEVYSLHTNAKQINIFTGLFDTLWSYHAYPELTFATYFERPAENLRQFDEVSAKRKITLFAGNDAHSNIGFHVFGTDTGSKFLSAKMDAYETVFGIVRTHIILEKDESLTAENLSNALGKGHAFVGFDVLSDTSDFLFSAENETQNVISGDEIFLNDNVVNLKAFAPQTARFIIFRNGGKVFEAKESTEVNFRAKQTGTYRVEVYLDKLGSPFDKMPWIISNPIYVK